MRPLLVLLLAAEVLGAASLLPANAAAPMAPLNEAQGIALPSVQRRIDHFAVDAAGQRLFVAALGNHSLEVLDLAAGKAIASIPGLNEPQGVAYLPSLHRIVVATRAGGTVTAFDDATYQPLGTIANLPDADNLRFDEGTGWLYVGHGDGALGVIDPVSMKLLADIALPGHPESFRLEAGSARIFVNLPPTREIIVVDRALRSVLAHVPITGFADDYPMSLDDRGHRMFVGVRRPARLLVFDTATLQRIADVPCAGDTDDLFYDARRDRVYVIGGEGYVDVFDASPAGRYARVARFPTRPGARTGLWSDALDRLFVASPRRDARPAAIAIFLPAP